MNHDKVLIRAIELHAADLGTVRAAREGFGCYTAWSGKVAVTVTPGGTVEDLLTERDRPLAFVADLRAASG